MIDMIISLAPALTILCFIGWGVGTATVLTGSIAGKFNPRDKLPWYDPWFIIIRITIMLWLSMWVFRSMFNGPVW